MYLQGQPSPSPIKKFWVRPFPEILRNYSSYFTIVWPCIVTGSLWIKPTDALFHPTPGSKRSQLRKIYQSRYTAKNSWWWIERLPETCRVVIPIKLGFNASVGFIHMEYSSRIFTTTQISAVRDSALRRQTPTKYGRRLREIDCVWNEMAHAQKPDFIFLRKGRIHLNRRGRQFSRLLATEVCASAVVMLDTPCSEVV